MFNNFGSPPPTKFDAPFPSWSHEDVQLVECVIATAWQFLLADTSISQVLSKEKEVNISLALIDIIEGMLNAKSLVGFTGERFSPPIRGQELVDVTNQILEMRPDISFRLNAASPVTQHNSLFYECKRIAPTKSILDYVNEGLIKFCDQRYAWGMPHAGMIAYVQNLNPVPTAKTELDKHWAKAANSATNSRTGVSVEIHHSITIAVTQHIRSKPLPNNTASTDITLRHLWLST